MFIRVKFSPAHVWHGQSHPDCWLAYVLDEFLGAFTTIEFARAEALRFINLIEAA